MRLPCFFRFLFGHVKKKQYLYIERSGPVFPDQRSALDFPDQRSGPVFPDHFGYF